LATLVRGPFVWGLRLNKIDDFKLDPSFETREWRLRPVVIVFDFFKVVAVVVEVVGSSTPRRFGFGLGTAKLTSITSSTVSSSSESKSESESEDSGSVLEHESSEETTEDDDSSDDESSDESKL